MIRIGLSLLLLFWCAGCGGATPEVAPTPVVGSPVGPASSNQTFTVSGEVSADGAALVGASPVNLWVQTARVGYSYWFANGRLDTDANGHYTAPNVPAGAHVTVYVSTAGYVQPCAVQADVNRDISLNIELISESSLAVSSRPPQNVTGPLLSGIAFEMTDQGRRPVSAAMVRVETNVEFIAATTKTDAEGRFVLCNLPPHTLLTIQKPGLQDASRPVPEQPSGVLEIQLMR